MNRRSFLQSVAVGSAGMAAAPGRAAAEPGVTAATKTAATQAPRQPNLLFLWTDQHRGDTVPWAGNTALRANEFFAPLGERSFVFHDAHVTQPVCTPSRASILTGLWPHNHGATTNNLRLRPDLRCLAEYLPSNYQCGYFGKWHLGDENSAQHGFREWRAIEDGYRQHYSIPAERKRLSGYHHFLLAHGFPPDGADPEVDTTPVFSRTMAAALPERYTKVAYLADEAVRFLRARRDGRPFALLVNSLEPHPPMYGPLNELHDPATLPVGPAFMRPPGPEASQLCRRHHEKLQKEGFKNHPFKTEADFRRLRANYYGLVSLVDRAYARVMRALEESGQADNTIVVYTSDHGELLGDHLLMQKSQFYTSATHVPLAIQVPWLSRRRVDLRGPISLVDLLPPLLELMGVAPPAAIDGRSRAGALRAPGTWRPEDIVVEWNDAEYEAQSGRSLVAADGWKLNLWRGDAPELFDLNRDPGELRNLARDANQRDRRRRMADQLRAWQTRTQDALPLAAG